MVHSTRQPRRATAVRPGRLVLVLFVLGALAWPADRGLQAQEPKRQVEIKKTEGPIDKGPPAMKQPPPPAVIELKEAELKLLDVRMAEVRQMLIKEAVQRFHFKIDPNTPLKDLLPTPPKSGTPAGPLVSEDLSQVPEVAFEAAPGKQLAGQEATRHIAHQIAKINHLKIGRAHV